jgi:hypothetical protein
MQKRRLARAALAAQRPLLARREFKPRHAHNLHPPTFWGSKRFGEINDV